MRSEVRPSRQAELNFLVSNALNDPDIREAMHVFQLSEHEYARAVAATVNIKITTSNRSTLEETIDAKLDSDEKSN